MRTKRGPGDVAVHPPTSSRRITRGFLAFIRRRKIGDTIPLAIRLTNRAHPHQCQIAAKGGNEFVAICRSLPSRICRHLPPSAEGFSRDKPYSSSKRGFCVREVVAVWTRNIRAIDRLAGRGPVQSVTASSPKTVHVRAPTKSGPQPQLRPRPDRGRDRRRLSANYPCPVRHPR